MEITELCDAYDVIGVDEGQFFAEIVEFCELMANKSKTVLVSALDGTFERKPFGNIINLIPLAERVIKLCAVCVYCACEAAFTKRIVESKEVELIGGAEMYKPVCRGCFFQEQESKKRMEELKESVVEASTEVSSEEALSEEQEQV
jgi:thymidine kinase